MAVPRRKAHPARQERQRTLARTRQDQQKSVDIAALKARIGDQWLDLLRNLAPELDEACDEFPEHVPCPMHGGRDGFRLFDDAEETGGGVCNTCGAFSDGIELLKAVKGWGFLETVRRIQDYLAGNLDEEDEEGEGGESQPAQRGVRSVGEETSQWAASYIARVAEDAEAGHERLVAYYRQRGLSIDPPDSIGYLAAEKYHQDGGGTSVLPAMVAALDAPDGTTVAILRTYLSPEGDGKADVDPAKKMSKAIFPGATKGAAIRLRDPSDGVIGLSEGIETAEAVFEATGISCWAAGNAGGMERFEPPAGITGVIIWADNDDTGTGQRAAANLARRLYDKGLAVSVVIPPTSDADWLDILLAEGAESLQRHAERSPLRDPGTPDAADGAALFPSPEPPRRPKSDRTMPRDKMGPDEAINRLNQTHFVVPVGGKVHITTETIDPDTGKRDILLSDRANFRLLYANWRVPVGDESIPAADLWMGSPKRREYRGILFSPGKDVPGWYNMWHGFSVEPAQGNCCLFWQHLFFVICRQDRSHYIYIRKWLAHLVQHPWELPGVALVIRGRQGTGKTIFVDLIGELVRQHYLVLTNMEQLTGRFSWHLKDQLLVNANEAVWGGNRSGEGALKSMVTDKQTPVEGKFKDLINVANCKRIVVTSNKPWTVPMEADDRRFLVLEASDERKEDKAYFGALLRQMHKKGGLAALLYDLLWEDLTGFDVRTKPTSPHAIDIKLRSAEPVVQWWHGCLVVGTLGTGFVGLPENAWEETPTRAALHGSFQRFCEEQRLRTLTREIFGRDLRKMLPHGSLRETRPNTGGADGEGSHRPHRYVLPSLEECREAFEAFFCCGTEVWE